MAKGGLSLMQRVAICFAAGVVGALAVVLFSYVLFRAGIGPALGVKAPSSISPPDIYRPLFWGGLWGIPFGLLVKGLWSRLYTFGWLYFLAPVLALYLVFMPMRGMGYFAVHAGLPFAFYLLVVNVPYGIVTAAVSRLIIGPSP